MMREMTRIHPTALIDPKANLDSSVEVGAYSIIGPHVSIGANTKIASHVVIDGHTTIGCDNHFHAFSSIGGPPQDKKYGGEVTYLEMGDRNLVREFCTFNCGTVQDKGITKIGSDNWFLAYVHIAHDCVVGSRTIFSNNAALAGHVEVGDWVIMSGFSAVHQFCKIGAHAFVGMNTSLTQDVPPFVLVSGNPAQAHGVNLEGLKRRGFTREELNGIRQTYKLIYKSGFTLDQAKLEIENLMQASNVAVAKPIQAMRDFLDTSTRGIAR